MYKISIRNVHDTEVRCYLVEELPTDRWQEEILKCHYMCYIDICRCGMDTLSDTANFRDEVEADLEPFSLEPFIEELLK